jgi:hypothetical protein
MIHSMLPKGKDEVTQDDVLNHRILHRAAGLNHMNRLMGINPHNGQRIFALQQALQNHVQNNQVVGMHDNITNPCYKITGTIIGIVTISAIVINFI